ncbi:MAG: hypothetical protein LKF49_08070 [Bifidobacterium tibiigranuli]|jgi:hypothetical protein|uniref:hypothetical protein n=1 Tax=Bifidobacterium tibiigranuli TaxID=2172043 RepID=UPI002354B485|nr:hypothetical protein [Bifidobacterium tibiigranuli]MCH3975493.1 hypothetical protein [Bifidobacterium tibiigranuli]MCH4204148.1 hypothetical protein [Bifidobacterium tibiigranuli]
MNATAQLRVGGMQFSEPSLRVLQAMTGTTAPRVISWFGDGITVVSIPLSSTDPTPPDLIRREEHTEPLPPRVEEPAPVSAPTLLAHDDGQADDTRRRSALDVRNLLHQTAQRLIDEQHAREQQAASGSSDSSVLTHEDERNARMDTVKR